MRRTRSLIINSLSNCYDREEIDSFISIIYKAVLHFSKTDVILNSELQLSEEKFSQIAKITERLQRFEPIQYILGETEFYNLSFIVNSSVLIPRNETEELVDLIIKAYSLTSPKILDIGTGTGCIPIAIKKNIPAAEVHSCDISESALSVARRNAELNEVEIHLSHFDILSKHKFPEENFDIIVSNPPYVTLSEKIYMRPNVLENEPHSALFVPDNDPLLFYRTIIENYSYLLKPVGEFFFEINEAFANETQQLLEKNNFKSQLIKDINDKNRIIRAQRR